MSSIALWIYLGCFIHLGGTLSMTQPKRVDSQTLFISSVIFFLQMGPKSILAMEMNKSGIQDLQGPTKLFCLNINIEIFRKKALCKMHYLIIDWKLRWVPCYLQDHSGRIRQEKNCKNIIKKGMLNHVPRGTHCFVVQETKTLSRVFMAFHGFSIDLTN